MTSRGSSSMLAALACYACCGANAAEMAVRFYPPDQVWAYPLESARSLQGVLIHNTALVNEGSKPITVTRVEWRALRAAAVISTVALDAARLDGIARQGSALAESGMLQALDFQFAPGRLLGTPPHLSDSRTLAPGTALLLIHQFLSFKGEADRVQVSVQLADGDDRTAGELAIRHGAGGTFHFPLQGRWFVGAGATPHNHHRWVVPEEFALDLAQIGAGGRSHRGDGTRMTDYYAYGAPVLAVGAGEVVRVHDGEADNVGMLRRPDEALADYQQRLLAGQGALLAKGADAIAGNHIVIRHAEGVYGVYAHLRSGSLEVAVGDTVRAGEQIASIGGSGNSTEPHLHFHLCDAGRPLHCAGLPVAFDNIEIPWSDGPRVLQSGDFVLTR